MNSPNIREISYATSQSDTESWTPSTSDVITKKTVPTANQRIGSGVEQEDVTDSLPSEHSTTVPGNVDGHEEPTAFVAAPGDSSHWAPQTFDLAPEIIDHGSQNFAETDCWPYMTVQEAYLMRHFVDKLACWVGYSTHSEKYELTSDFLV